MAVEFLIGPAGSGKTHTCLTQVREALAAAEGPPLLWIAPKQFTFQLEREVLARGVRGFTRLEILPFDRLARRVLGELGVPIRDVLSEEGRVMVLHATLLQKASQLTVFRQSARAAGFASQLSQVLRELQRSGIGSERLRGLSLNRPSPQPSPVRRERVPDLSAVTPGAKAEGRVRGIPSGSWPLSSSKRNRALHTG